MKVVEAGTEKSPSLIKALYTSFCKQNGYNPIHAQ